MKRITLGEELAKVLESHRSETNTELTLVVPDLSPHDRLGTEPVIGAPTSEPGPLIRFEAKPLAMKTLNASGNLEMVAEQSFEHDRRTMLLGEEAAVKQQGVILDREPIV